jgi:hypothetical protein
MHNVLVLCMFFQLLAAASSYNWGLDVMVIAFGSCPGSLGVWGWRSEKACESQHRSLLVYNWAFVAAVSSEIK